MPAAKKGNAQGAPQSSCEAALVLVDFINDMAFDGGDALHEGAVAAAPIVRKLRSQADRLGVPVIYVNDNYGHWHSERSRIVERCMRPGSPARDIVGKLVPRARDYFVVKPHLSGFYATSLPVLLPKLGVRRLVLTGVAADICVLFTAADAHMRDYALWVPRDAVASESDERTGWALDIMQKSMNAEVRPSTELTMHAWLARRGKSAPRAR